MDKHKVLTRLVWDLESFLSLLDSESLSYMAQAQKKSLSQLLSALHRTDAAITTSAVEAEYMVMSCPSSSPCEHTDTPPSPPPDVMWSSEPPPQRKPAILTVHRDEDNAYEEAAPYSSQTPSADRAESDSSHYESYGDEDDDDEEEVGLRGGARPLTDRHYVQWSASQPCLRPAPESRLCGFLWRRKWLGQWTKQLFIIQRHVLMVYKRSRDPVPQMELDLRGCFLMSKSKPQRRIPHTLRLLLPGSESLVLGFSDYQQALEWRKVMEELSSGETEVHSTDLSRSSLVLAESDDDKAIPSQHHPQNKGNVSAGFLNVLMNCQWQSLRCEVEEGVLNMFAHKDHDLDLDQDLNPHQRPDLKSGSRTPQYTLSLRGCQVTSGPDTSHSYRITLSELSDLTDHLTDRPTDRLAVLEVNNSEEKQHWIKLLRNAANPKPERTEARPSLSRSQSLDLDSNETQPLYSNSSVLQHTLHSPKNMSEDTAADRTGFSNNSGGDYRCVQRLELAGKSHGSSSDGVQLRVSESERHLAAKNKRTSFRQSLAVCSERAQSGFLAPLLRRTASAKLALKRSPSVPFIESGRVSNRKQEWETKAVA